METKNLSLKLGGKLLELRRLRGLTQSDLAEEASMLLPNDARIYQRDISLFEKKGEGLTLDKIDAAFSVLGQSLWVSEKKTLPTWAR